MRLSKKWTALCGLALAAALMIMPVRADAAKTKKVYLIKEVAGQKFTYSDKGLLKKRTYGGVATNYYYNNNQRLKKVTMTEKGKTTETIKYTYNKKKQLTRITVSSLGTTSKYSWKKNRIKTCKIYFGKKLGTTVTYSYNKKGYVKKATYKYTGIDKAKSRSFTWNSKGDLTKRQLDDGSTPTIKITYKNGKPVKSVVKYSSDYKSSNAFTCKSFKVKNAYRKTVETQQRMIRNTVEFRFEPGALELGFYDFY